MGRDKKRGISILLISLILLTNLIYFIIIGRKISEKSLVGFTIKESIIESISELSLIGKIFFMTQLILIVLLLIKMNFHSKIIEEKEEVDENLKSKINERKINETELDKLFDILKERKIIKVGDICKMFGITKETALNWSKILESYNLVIVEYKSFDEPLCKINENALNEK